MKWYNKPITWKGYGIMCLSALLMGVLSIVAMILYPEKFIMPWNRFAEKIWDKISGYDEI